MLQPFILRKEVFTNNVNSAGQKTDGIGYSLFAFDVRYQRNFSSAQQPQVIFNFDGSVTAGVVA